VQMATGWSDALRLVPKDVSHLLLLSNFSGSQLATRESELALYREILERHVPAGSRVLVKPHPGSAPDFVAALIASLPPGRWNVEVLQEALLSMPVELAHELLARCTVLSLSFATVSLRYLHGSTVIHALDDSLIESHILPAKKKWVKDGNDVYLRMAAKLATWDRKSPL
jgi:hypothetical protein